MIKNILQTLLFILLLVLCNSSYAAEITGFVWKDNNGDGFQSIGEPGIPNVEVFVYECGTDILLTTGMTDLTGKYEILDLAIGSIYLSFSTDNIPADCAFTLLGPAEAPTNNSADADGNTECIEIETSEDEAIIHAGLLPLAGVCGVVWEDFDGNGLRESIDFPLMGFAVELFDENGSFIVRTVADSMGQYSLDNIYPGSYFLKFHPLAEWEVTFANQGDQDTIDNDVDWENGIGTTRTFYLGAGEKAEAWDAGYFRCGDLGKWVWYDTDFDDVFDLIENGINGMIVNAYRLVNGNWVHWERATTGHKPGTPSDDGYFEMCLPPGKYYLEYEIELFDLVPVLPFASPDKATSSSVMHFNGAATTDTIYMFSGVSNCNVNAGFYPEARVGGTVWKDLNADGMMQMNEPSMGNIKVELYDAASNLIAEQITDANGEYFFTHIRKGAYYVQFFPTDGCQSTIANAGNDEANDSDVTDENGPFTTDIFEVYPEDVATDFNLGLRQIPLSVPLASFHHSILDGGVRLGWSLSDDSNVLKYVIEKKEGDKALFVDLATILPETGSRQYMDNHVRTNLETYYRLRVMLDDGSYFLTKVISIRLSNDTFRVYPNPASDILQIDMPNDGCVHLRILTLDGKEVYNNKCSKEIDISDLLPSTYLIYIIDDNSNVFTQIITKQ